MAVTRIDILNELIRQRGYRRYLEIGVQYGHCFRAIRGATRKVAVDPSPLFKPSPSEILHAMGSDDFFAANQETFDLIFVDGLHHADQVLRDVRNALSRLAPGGLVVMHDCNPSTEAAQIVPRQAKDWNGDVWRAFVRLRMDLPYRCFVLDTDHGVGIIDPSTPAKPLSLSGDPMNAEQVSYQDFAKVRTAWLNLTHAEPLAERLKPPVAKPLWIQPLADLAADQLPWITSLCATYGRFTLLQDVVTCFLNQDYPRKRLLILNDAETPLTVADEFKGIIEIKNVPKMFSNLGEKRQALLEMAQTELVAQWDDDDLYLPWHLSRSVAALLRTKMDCVKSAGAWGMLGSLVSPPDAPRVAGPNLVVKGIQHNVYEGTMVFKREAALALGGYQPIHSGQAKALLEAFTRAKRAYVIPDHEEDRAPADPDATLLATTVSYIYRWSQPGVGHISAIGNKPNAIERFAQTNRDFGNGQPLARADLSAYWPALMKNAGELLAKDDADALSARMGPLLQGGR